MEIKNIEGLSGAEVRKLVSEGGKFVLYKYCISIVIASFNNPSAVYFIRPNQSAVSPAIGMLFVNLFLGWWGIPWGPIYTIGNIGTILSGGKDVTIEIMSQINQNDPNYGASNNYNIPGQQNSSGSSSTYNIPNQANKPEPTGASAYNIPK